MTVPGLPVIVASNGKGLPVTVVTTGKGIPIQTSTNGFGIPIVVKASGGLPVQYVGSAPIQITATLLTNGLAINGTSVYNTASVTPTAGKLVLVFTHSDNYTADVADPAITVAGAGLTFTKIADAVQLPQWTTSSLWRACSNSPSTGAITITHTLGKKACGWVVMEFDAAAIAADNGASAIIQFFAQSPGVDTPLTSFTSGLATFANAQNGVAVYGAQDGPASMTSTPSAGVTEVIDQTMDTASGFWVHSSAYFKNSADVNAGYTNSSGASFNTVSTIAVELKAKNT